MATSAAGSRGIVDGRGERAIDVAGLRQKVQPRMALLEQARQHYLKSTLRLGGAIVAVFVVVGIVAVIFAATPSGPGIVFLVMGAMGGGLAFVFGALRQRRWHAMGAEFLAPDVCSVLGDVRYDRRRAAEFPVDTFEQAGVFRAAKGRTLDHLLHGSYRGIDFKLAAAELRPRKGGSSKHNNTIFRGVLVTMALPAPCRILIQPKTNALEALARIGGDPAALGLEPIAVDSVGLDARYRVYADDREQAAAFLRSGIGDRLLAVATSDEARGGQRLHGAFYDGQCLLALARRDQFLAVGSLFRPLDDVGAALEELVAGFGNAHRLIDQLFPSTSAGYARQPDASVADEAAQQEIHGTRSPDE
jgi:hypothetical protein